MKKMALRKCAPWVVARASQLLMECHVPMTTSAREKGLGSETSK